MAEWAASAANDAEHVEYTVPQLVGWALDEDGPGAPVDLDHGTDWSQVTKMGTALAKLRDQRFGDHVLRGRRSKTARTWYLELVKKATE